MAESTLYPINTNMMSTIITIGIIIRGRRALPIVGVFSVFFIVLTHGAYGIRTGIPVVHKELAMVKALI